MINTEKPFNIHDYLEVLLRRLWTILIPFVLILSASVLYALYSPKEYRAKAVILVTPQKIPEAFVKPTITSKIEDRLKSIDQEIMSRASLEKVISEFKLYPEEIKTSSMEEVVEWMRKNIEIEIKGKEGYFSIAYIGKEPRVVAMVTNKLTSLFTEENLKFREQQAQGTSEFLSTELNATKAKLDEQEGSLMKFKRQFMGELPEQREANIRVIEQLQNHYQRVNENVRSAQDRKIIIQKQLSDLEFMIASLSRAIDLSAKEAKEAKEEVPSPQPPPLLNSRVVQPSPLPPPLSPSPPKTEVKDPLEVQLGKLKDSLKGLEFKYTEKHPDIILTKKMIKELEPIVEKARMDREAHQANAYPGLLPGSEGSKENPDEGVQTTGEKVKVQREADPVSVSAGLPPVRKSLRDPLEDRLDKQELQRLRLRHQEIESQLIATNLEIERFKEEEAKVRTHIGKYRERIENTPAREQAMMFLTRDYQNTKDAYQNLQIKYEDSRRAENLERRQKGEQFKVIEPALIPVKPFRPNIPKILLLGLMFGLGGGFGLAFMIEQTDRSFRDASDLETTLGLRVLANIPKVKKETVTQSA